MTIIAVDPGMSGAVCVVGPASLEVFDTPIIKGEKGVKNQFDSAAMVKILMRGSVEVPVHVFIERVGAMPGQGVTSMFRFGMGFGMWLGMIAALQLPVTLVTPQRWKGVMMDGMGREKSAARLRAQQLFPASAHLFARVKDDGRAEAALLAEYGRRTLSTWNGQQSPSPKEDGAFVLASETF